MGHLSKEGQCHTAREGERKRVKLKWEKVFEPIPRKNEKTPTEKKAWGRKVMKRL